ncbi:MULTISPECIES: stage 0 sporulation family protein [unclassified Olleya]|jgi:cell fate regulator YaaT (PSP1 superfamily)|uniref:PSP1 domain-containing protein n=1 Tax=unclassified Olleya TaxID=2615019 RepID=UPI0011A18A9A|nr:regulatory iron-sulfur-containing complex subunit RicT [Olleya sp. Hel_I_94]TVZ48036.1 cell fate regulator YaaT (PSP1 superfamily) [Olleya sp. Hel_I_94]|tara:strand:- start:172816 stop:174183 length:1368 start_codon:yes stop_codon:yes gene_type:complete
MACQSCATGKDGQPKGCKNNGTCGTDSCNKLTVFDWLANMSVPNGEKPFDWVEVRFKNGRKHYYHNSENLTLSIGDIVATQAQSGHDIGMVTLTGELVRVQIKRKKIDTKNDILKIYRKASQKDIDIWSEARDKEEPMKVKARQFAIDLKLSMKISDIEFQGDSSKATFYYTAEERVDFRELIKIYAREFRIRIEMKQVGFRQEASRLGGIGSCGRELCCSTWLTDFRSVSTSAARYQQLSLNPQKLAGQCGKLKCCLNYELDSYLDALKAFPKPDTKLYTEKGTAVCQKTDIFKGHMWYAYEGEWMNWHLITTDQAREIIAINKKREKVASLEEYAVELLVDTKTEFENVVGQDSLTRFDSPKSNKKRKNNRSRNKKPVHNKAEVKTTDNKKAKPNKRVNTNNKNQANSKAQPNKNQPNKSQANSAKPKPKPRPKRKPNKKRPENNNNSTNENK